MPFACYPNLPFREDPVSEANKEVGLFYATVQDSPFQTA